MDVVSSATWFSELEMEEYPNFKNHQQMTNPSTDSLLISSESLTDNYPHMYPMNQSFETGYIGEDLAMQSNNPFASTTRVTSSKTFIMSFGNPPSDPEMSPDQPYDGSDLKNSDFAEGAKRVSVRNMNQAQDHVLAERKRRERLNRQFISLSALVPNLKKMDKASVLEGATECIKQLQTRVKELEEEASVNSQIFYQELAVSTRRSPSNIDDHVPTSSSSCDETPKSVPDGDNTFNPDIEVRILESSVLVRIIYSYRNSSIVTKILSEMERLHLNINSSSAIPFSTAFLLITVSAQMTKECILTAKDVVKSLQSAIRDFV